jgi:hypothetical protein
MKPDHEEAIAMNSAFQTDRRALPQLLGMRIGAAAVPAEALAAPAARAATALGWAMDRNACKQGASAAW